MDIHPAGFCSFHSVLAGRKTYVQAYSQPTSLKTGFDWYRAFVQDEKDNLGFKDNLVQTPVLYLRGEYEAGNLERYLNGFRAGGLCNVQEEVIPNGGRFAPDEQPEQVLEIIRRFIGLAK